MARFSRLQVLNRMVDVGVIPVFYHADVETALKIVEACAAGGAKIVEFTNRGDLAYEVFVQIVKYVRKNLPDVVLGVGSIVDPGTAALYLSSGTDFVVGPNFNPEVARVCNRRKVPYSPGCGSVTEIGQAEEMGVEIVKIFPGDSVGGPDFVRALLGPCPWSSVMPTGGVDASQESINAWIKAGAVCLGMGSKLITKELVAAKDWDGITAKTRQVLAWVKEARGK